MTSNPSLTKKNLNLYIYLWTLKKYIGFSTLITSLMLLSMPVTVFISALSRNSLNASVSFKAPYLSSQKNFIPLIIIAIIILCSMIFSYMHSKNSIDTFHSLPVSRTTLFLGKYLAGLTLIVIPTILTLGITYIIKITMNLTGVTNGEFLKFALSLVIMEFASFTALVLIAVNTGTIADMLASFVLVNALWTIAVLLITTLMSITIYGFGKNLLFELYFVFSPVARLVFSSLNLTWWTIIFWAGMGFLFLLLSIISYKHRKSETTGTLAYKGTKILFKILSTINLGLFIGILFLLILTNIVFFFVGFIIGSLILHTIIEMIDSRGFKGYARSLVIYFLILGMFSGFYVVISTGALGFEKNIPKIENIKSVYVEGIYHNNYNRNGITLTEKENIELVLSFHNEIVEDIGDMRSKSMLEPAWYNIGDGITSYQSIYFFDDTSIKLTYELNNGSKITRTFNINKSKYPESIERVYEALELLDL